MLKHSQNAQQLHVQTRYAAGVPFVTTEVLKGAQVTAAKNTPLSPSSRQGCYIQAISDCMYHTPDSGSSAPPCTHLQDVEQLPGRGNTANAKHNLMTDSSSSTHAIRTPPQHPPAGCRAAA
jgi:hypothetical protein